LGVSDKNRKKGKSITNYEILNWPDVCAKSREDFITEEGTNTICIEADTRYSLPGRIAN
jgi:hypothetical protein